MIENLIRFEFNLLDKIMMRYESITNRQLKIDIRKSIRRLVDTIDILADKEKKNSYFSDLLVMPFIKRAINLPYGEGLRYVSYIVFIELHQVFPDTMERLLSEFPYIGYWGDLNNLYKELHEDKTSNYYSNRLINKIINIWCSALEKQEIILNNKDSVEYNSYYFSLLCKWIPRQNSSLNKSTGVVNKIVKNYYPIVYKKNRFKALKKYRQLVAAVNRELNTTEIKMCSRNFSDIKFSEVPVKCLEKHKRSWLDINKSGKRNNLMVLDRTVARSKFLNFIKDGRYTTHIEDDILIDEPLLLNKLKHPVYDYYREIIYYLGEVTSFTNA